MDLTVLFFAQVSVIGHIDAPHGLHSLPAVISSRTDSHLTQRFIIKTTVIEERDGGICNAKNQFITVYIHHSGPWSQI